MLDKLTMLEAHTKAAIKLAKQMAATNAPSVRDAAKAGEKQLLQKMQLDRHMHEIHCFAVELGLADQQPHRYGEKRIAIGFGREVLDPRRAPATVQDSLMVAAAPALVPLNEQEIVKCIIAAGCVGTVKMSYESGPYDIDRPSWNATKLADAFTAALATRNGLTVGGDGGAG